MNFSTPIPFDITSSHTAVRRQVIIIINCLVSSLLKGITRSQLVSNSEFRLSICKNIELTRGERLTDSATKTKAWIHSCHSVLELTWWETTRNLSLSSVCITDPDWISACSSVALYHWPRFRFNLVPWLCIKFNPGSLMYGFMFMRCSMIRIQITPLCVLCQPHV